MVRRVAERWKWVPRATVLIAFVLLALGLLAISQSERAYREQKAQEIDVQARILAMNVTAALDFADTAAAQEAVSALRANPQIRLAGVYDAAGSLFAGYRRDRDVLAARVPSDVAAESGRVVSVEPVMRGDEQLGTIYIVADIDQLSRRITRYGLVALLAVMAVLIIAVLGFFQSALRRANLDLTETNRELIKQIEGREEAEQQLRQAQKMEAIGQLTGGIAHDFNNMLAIVVGNLDMARRRVESAPKKALDGIGNALEGAHRAADLTRRLLAFARRQPLEPQVLEVNKLVGNMSELLRRTIGEQLEIETVLAGGLWRVHADPGQLENAILNLCVNARDAMVEGGNLTIETLNAHLDDGYARQVGDVPAGQYVAVAISDTGPGMAPDVAERAFEPFFTTKGVGKGTGLGLSQVYGFVKQSGGHVKIYSELGRGTTVKIYLPRYFGKDRPAEAREAQPVDVPHALAGETILVVEDEDHVRRMSADTLRELGYAVIEAASGEEALARLDEHPGVGLLFTDIVMPGMTGRQLADHARETRPDLVVVFTTGYTRNAVVHNGVLDPDIAFIAKPFTLEQLAYKMRAAFDGRGANRSGGG